ncbi:hypothetical protein Cgig2_012835 [Carnegiea gigantea]|uniref:SAM domain-containing protein n=1 Tax=Carnegiea gigantea TaxID=171969 RepID=A0A9Q1K9P8_9CARY|nr:hypothetical protein Cgig2_012835 [Carnegiea gigantea]
MGLSERELSIDESGSRINFVPFTRNLVVCLLGRVSAAWQRIPFAGTTGIMVYMPQPPTSEASFCFPPKLWLTSYEMVKPKQKHLAAVVVKSSSSQNSAGNPLNIVDSDLSVEDNWVIVRKRTVNILIPSLPGTEPSTLLDPGQAQLLGNMHSTSANDITQLPDEICQAERNDQSLCLSPKADIPSVRGAHPSSDNVVGSMRPSEPSPQKMNSEQQLTALRSLHKEKRNIMHKTSAGLKPCRPFRPSELFAVSNMVSATIFRDKIMKASNLERKIVRAGGLDSWLSSLGLEQFTRIFRGKKINKFQLANLSMKKLKDMGACAVGPRRKLIHAIECAILF